MLSLLLSSADLLASLAHRLVEQERHGLLIGLKRFLKTSQPEQKIAFVLVVLHLVGFQANELLVYLEGFVMASEIEEDCGFLIVETSILRVNAKSLVIGNFFRAL